MLNLLISEKAEPAPTDSWAETDASGVVHLKEATMAAFVQDNPSVLVMTNSASGVRDCWGCNIFYSSDNIHLSLLLELLLIFFNLLVF